MHEPGAVARALHRMMLETGGQVSRVVGMVGPRLDRRTVADIWEETVAGTAAVSAHLILEPAFDLLRCMDCGTNYDGVLPETCPRCDGHGQVVERAAEFEVRSWMGPA